MLFDFRKIRTARKRANLSLDDVVFYAASLGYSTTKQTVSNHERGLYTPDSDALALYSLVLDQPVSYFFNRKPYETKLHKIRAIVGDSVGRNKIH